MSDVCKKDYRSVRPQRSIYKVHYCLPKNELEQTRPLVMPSHELQAYDKQVAGHNSTKDTKYLGLLQCNNGTILKPILKSSQMREVDFYERIKVSTDPDLVELKKYTPKYYGCRKFTYNGFEQDYLILEDLTQRMLEPCIMDVKIGRRTWDPLATEEKIKSEQSKYAACKQQFAFCIPGYQMYKLSTGQLRKYNKEYGKKLHGQMVRDAIKNFLNGMGTSLCRALLLQFLTELWKVQRWCARQRRVRIYCASLLLAYDAARLRECCPLTARDTLTTPVKCRSAPAVRRRSIHSLHMDSAGSNFSGQVSSKGPVYKKVNSVPLTCMNFAQNTFAAPPIIKSPWTEALEKLNHNHSFEHNYEDKLSKIKMNYRATLDQLTSDSPTPNPWGTVKIIDFAHAFFNDEEQESIDENFREGIDNFVSIFESFLSETDDQVF